MTLFNWQQTRLCFREITPTQQGCTSGFRLIIFSCIEIRGCEASLFCCFFALITMQSHSLSLLNLLYWRTDCILGAENNDYKNVIRDLEILIRLWNYDVIFQLSILVHEQMAKGSGSLLVRLYKDAGSPSTECSPTKFWKAFYSVMDHLLTETKVLGLSLTC